MRKFVSLIFIAIVLAAAVFTEKCRKQPVPPVQPMPIVVTAPKATFRPVPTARQNISYMDIVRSCNPNVPATQPLALPVELQDAAHLILHNPVYLDPLGHLWITSPDAPSAQSALKSPTDPTEHLITEQPVFVHWSINDNGDWSAFVVARKSANQLEIISSLNRRPIPAAHSYHWDRAFSWDGKMIVPSKLGVSVFDIEPQLREHYHALPGMTTESNATLTILDSRGVLAWAPWENGKTGSSGVCRFVDGQWMDLPTDTWQKKPMQLIPLLDGSVLEISCTESDKISLSINPLESTGIDEHHVNDLVDALSDPDDDKRQTAFDELSRYGPGLWPILEKITGQPAEARVRIKQLLRSKIAPALNGMSVIDNRLHVVNRQADGTVLLFAPLGVNIPNGRNDPLTVAPAWLAIHPNGHIDRPLPPRLVSDRSPAAPHLYCIHDDWIICDDNGVHRYFGNTLVAMLRPAENQFTKVLGVDRRGRWIFQKPGHSSGDILIIDPTVLDPTPRLPVWTMTIRNGSVGWTSDDYPVINRGGAWALKADTWEALNNHAKIYTQTPAAVPSPRTQPATESVEPSGPPLLVTKEGDQYYDGRDALTIVNKVGRLRRWPLPSAALGNSNPTLLRTSDGRLFLFNQPGKIVCLKPVANNTVPFEVQAIFTANIPNTAHPTRIWLDPLERIDFVYDNNVLAVMFPSGHVPSEIDQMMLDNSGN